ncbi:AI-2E family transporter [Corynebacterium sp. H113]|uniref:AI-2E family transporter n=1 Tax=Corynebacterium sp. H113 TaxID=3133419 RepID=UPI0040400E50
MGSVNEEKRTPNQPDHPDQNEKDFIDKVIGSDPLRLDQSLSIPSDEVREESSTPILPEHGEELQELNQDSETEELDRADVIGEGARWFAGWCLRFLIVVAALYVGFQFLGKVWTGLLPILLALIVSTVLWPPAGWLMRHKVPSGLASIGVILAAFSVIGGTFALMAPTVKDQVPELSHQFVKGIEKIQAIIQAPPFNVQDEQLLDLLDESTNWLKNQSGDIASTVMQGVSVVSSVAVTLGVMLVLTFFFVKDGKDFLPWLRAITGRRLGWHLTEVLTRSWNTLSGFVRTQALVSLIDAIFIGLGLWLLNVPLALVLAVLTFFAGFIPIIGAFTAGFMAVVVALVAVDVTAAVLTLVLVIAVQQIEGNILSPMLQSRAMNLHAAIVLLSVTLGGTLFGIIGAFLAVPVAAVIAVWLRYLGDLTDLRTGDKTAADIKFATEAGSISGIRIEEASRAMRDKLALLRLGGNSSTDPSGEKSSDDELDDPGNAVAAGTNNEGPATGAFGRLTNAVTNKFRR